MDTGAWWARHDWATSHSLSLFFGIGMKTDLFQSCGHCRVFQICWHIECSTFTASSFRIWNSLAGIPSPPLALFTVMLPKAHLPDSWLALFALLEGEIFWLGPVFEFDILLSLSHCPSSTWFLLLPILLWDKIYGRNYYLSVLMHQTIFAVDPWLTSLDPGTLGIMDLYEVLLWLSIFLPREICSSAFMT